MTKKIITFVSTAVLVLAFAASCMAKESFKLSGTYEEYLERPQRFIVVDNSFLNPQSKILITNDPIKILGLDVKIAEFYFKKDKNGANKNEARFELKDTNAFDKAVRKLKAAPIFKNAEYSGIGTSKLIDSDVKDFSISDKDIGIKARVALYTYKDSKIQRLYLRINTNGETELDQAPKGKIRGQRNKDFVGAWFEAALAQAAKNSAAQKGNPQTQASQAS